MENAVRINDQAEKFSYERESYHLRERDHCGDPGVDGRRALTLWPWKWTFK
jgi:hypothetical protein